MLNLSGQAAGASGTRNALPCLLSVAIYTVTRVPTSVISGVMSRGADL